MKNILILISASILLFATSCKKELEIAPHKIYYDNFYQTEEDAENAINAVYDVLGNVNQYRSSLWLIQDISSDDCFARTTLNDPNLHEFDDYNLNASNIYLAGIWESSYSGISKANIVIEKVSLIDMDSSKKNRIIGEARFLRALNYFNLVRLFGDVPLILKQISSNLNEEELYPFRENTTNVYSQIIEDLTLASELLPVTYYSNDKGRATKGAALGILSKVYLTNNQWELAEQTTHSVIELGVYNLHGDYANNFKEIYKNGIESLFEVQFSRDIPAENSQIVISGLPSIQGLFSAGVEIMIPSDSLLNSFEEGDYRKDITFFDHYWYYDFEPHIWKFWDQEAYEPDETSESGANIIVMRYSEVLLIYAEALNEVNSGPTTEAYEAINSIRERARNGNPDILPDLSGLSQEEFRAAVLNERRHEFVNEGQRWYDLVRTNNLIDYVKYAKGDQSNPQAFNYLFPIPQRERNINSNLSQNTGY